MSAPYEEQQSPYASGYPQPPGYDHAKHDPSPPPEYPGMSQSEASQQVFPGQVCPPPFPPPPPAPPQGQPQITTIIVEAPPMPAENAEFPRTPVCITCPSCHQAVVTVTSHECGLCTALICTSLVLVGCLLGFICIPFCVNGNMDVRHTCPSCNATVGVKKRFC